MLCLKKFCIFTLKVLKAFFSLTLNKKMAVQDNIKNTTNISQLDNEFLFVQISPGCINTMLLSV